MNGRIAALLFIGWGAIVALGVHLADERLELCGISVPDMDCRVRVTGERNDFIIAAAMIGLIFAAGVVAAMARRRPEGPRIIEAGEARRADRLLR